MHVSASVAAVVQCLPVLIQLVRNLQCLYHTVSLLLQVAVSHAASIQCQCQYHTVREEKNVRLTVEKLVNHHGDNVAGKVIVYTGDCMPAISGSANSVLASERIEVLH